MPAPTTYKHYTDIIPIGLMKKIAINLIYLSQDEATIASHFIEHYHV